MKMKEKSYGKELFEEIYITEYEATLDEGWTIDNNSYTVIITIIEFLEELEKLNTIRKDLEMCDNMGDLKKSLMS